MKKNYCFSIFAVIILGCITIILTACTKQRGNDKKTDGGNEEIVDSIEEFSIETLSDKDIYFKPDTMSSGSPVINDMLDVANSYAIMNAAYCDAELWFRFGMVVNDEIGQINTNVIKDEKIREAAEKYVKTLTEILPRDTAIWDESDQILWDKVWNAYKVYAGALSSRYALHHYGKITDEDVERYLNIRQFIPNYDSIYDLRRKQSEENERYLLSMVEQATDFDRECLYTVEYAHQRRHEEPHVSIPMLEKLMKSGKFSRYLHEVWRTWRCLKQIAQSPSRDGMILNREYNKMRYRCLNIVLQQIIKNPQDIYAINDFCFLATYDNIIRYSEFLFGNSAPLDQMMLFPEIFDEKDDEE